jgi:hypothetical protein
MKEISFDLNGVSRRYVRGYDADDMLQPDTSGS